MVKHSAFLISIPLNSIDHFNRKNNFISFSKEWIDRRLEIFFKYTLKSLLAQTNQEFLAILHVHESTCEYVRHIAKQFGDFPPNVLISHVGDDIFMDYASGCRKVMKLRLDSDNLIHSNYVESAKSLSLTSSADVFIGRLGYMFDTRLKRLVEWNHDSSAFNTYIYDYETYRNLRPLSSSEPEYHMLASTLNSIPLYSTSPSLRSFIFLVHEQNLQNEFESLCLEGHIGQFITDTGVIHSVLNEFGVIGN